MARTRFDKRPLAGSEVVIVDYRTQRQAVVADTDRDGKLLVRSLPPGEYGIEVTFRAVSLGGWCFHVRRQPSMHAGWAAKFDWYEGDVLGQVLQGTLLESRYGLGSGLARYLYASHVRVPGATLSLEEVPAGRKTVVRSDASGRYTFGKMPVGHYVLTIVGGDVSTAYPEDRRAIRLVESEPLESYSLSLQDRGCYTRGFERLKDGYPNRSSTILPFTSSRGWFKWLRISISGSIPRP